MYVDIMQVRNSEVLLYKEWRGIRKPVKTDMAKLRVEAPAYSGAVTDGSRKRLGKAISLLVQMSPTRRIWNPVISKHHDFSISFITLTVADQGKDTAGDVYQKCLAPWVRWGRSVGMKNYVWKAELQERGAVHYHLVTDIFLHYQQIKDKWNNYQKKAGYLNSFAARELHFKANSTDVHSVKNVKDIEQYLQKYMMKKGDGTIDGKVWDCSKNLKSAKYYSTELTWQNLDKIRQVAKSEYIGEHCAFYRIPSSAKKFILDGMQQQEYNNHLLAIK